ncbi:uncharacterized protein TNCV_4108051 [Trichonephila clavipes]|nr:uncharacterized protein TNCV_4108051 [Trichonephila clavipes]
MDEPALRDSEVVLLEYARHIDKSEFADEMIFCKSLETTTSAADIYAASPLGRLVEGEDRCEASGHPQSILPLNSGGIESNRTVTCMVLKATANDRRHLALCHDESRGSLSGLCRSGGISNNNNKHNILC